MVERYEQGEHSLPSNSIFCEQKVDQTNDVQRKIKLRNRDVTVNKGRFNQNQPSSSQHNIEKKNERQKHHIVYKEYENKREKTKEVKQPALMDVEKTVSTFNLQTELSKLKISIPFNELLRTRST